MSQRVAPRANQRVVYLNGNTVPESEAMVPFKDRGYKFGDAVFDTTRTFGHRIFRLREHLERLQRSLRYLKLDAGLSLDEFVRVTEEVVERNLPLIGGFLTPEQWTAGLLANGFGDVRVVPDIAAIRAQIALPRSKSVANRALLCAALAGDADAVQEVPSADDTVLLARLLRDRDRR